jgi:cell division septation protein DedD
MAAANGKKGYRLRFELSLAGLLGVGVVCFCIFLWMFLLGLWAGQTGLISGISFTNPPAIPAATKPTAMMNKAEKTPEIVLPPPEQPPVQESAPVPAVSAPASESGAVAAPQEAKGGVTETAQAEAPAFYAIQVGAFRDNRYVEEALQKWRAKGYEPFSRPPGAGEHLTKVYLGRFPEASAARKELESLAKKEGITPVVAVIPADSGKSLDR